MATISSANRVLYGPHAGRTKAEMEAKLATLQTNLDAVESAIESQGTINGQSVSIDPQAVARIKSAIRSVQAALAQVDPSWPKQSQVILPRFR